MKVSAEKTSHSPVAALAIGLIISGFVFAEEQPWQKLYTGKEAVGNHVIGLWQFQPGKEAEDSSGNGHKLTLRGKSRFVEGGKFGSCLESFDAGTGKENHAEGASVADKPQLSPKGAFTLEAWFQLRPEASTIRNLFLIDKKYVNYTRATPQFNRDYCFYLDKVGNKRRLTAHLGYEKDSAFYRSKTVALEDGRWYYAAFAYDGRGMGRFFLDGQAIGRIIHKGRGPVSPGPYPVCIGARVGSTHVGFPGFIDQVRITNGIASHFQGGIEASTAAGRAVFVRMEKDAKVALTLFNDTGKKLDGGTADVELAGGNWSFPITEVPPSGSHLISLPIDTSARPGKYQMKVTISANGGEQVLRSEQQIPITIVPRPLPNQMPVVMWGGGDIHRLKELGFTHQLTWLIDYNRVLEAGQPVDLWSSDLGERLDMYLANGFGALANLYPARWMGRKKDLVEKYERVDRGGQRYGKDDVCGNFPEVRQFSYNVGASVAQSFGQYPALSGALIHSEIRGHTALCFHKHDKEAYRKASGLSIPAELPGKTGRSYIKVKGFPLKRIIPDDDPLLTYLGWFWKEGDGWNEQHSQVSRGLHSTGRDDIFTWYDPAVRVPSRWGSGGEVDVISQWTYSYPDPIKIGESTDELFAMAAGRPGQKVMKMTQIIWYRTGTTGDVPEDESKRAQWEKDKPDAKFVTIAPDHLREAFWSKISRPIRGIMYHGHTSLLEVKGNTHGYRFTNPRTQHVLAELTRDVVRPLGPTLLQVPDRKADVGILQSFSSQMYAGRGSWGWSHQWDADVHLVLQYAQLQPRILYEETVVRDGLDGLKVLVMANCDVLPESVAAKVMEFQRNGGLIIGDERLAPGITPDILVPSYKRINKPVEDKSALQSRAVALRAELDEFYERYGESSSPDVIVRFRRHGSTDYLFALNDRRTFGDYVGHHGKVMEKGLPSEARLSVRRKKGYVYDLVAHKRVKTNSKDGDLVFDASFGPGGGHLYMITDAPIKRVKIDKPDVGARGKSARIKIQVASSFGRDLEGVIPVEVKIVDSQGRPAEPSGFYGALNGSLNIELVLAKNDLPGNWKVSVQELASGESKEAGFRVE
ncbi:MAG: LamG domain-containing protein [Planctomycetota bacterium]|nr:LamG domain-containing protein [Planctomycetota bacterium]